MAKSSSGTLPDAIFTVLVQIYGAFAQGAGHLSVDDGVILQAREDYVPLITRDLERWGADGARTLATTRAMGQLAAHKALKDGEVIIRRRHYRAAQRDIHRMGGICPFVHPRRS
jgi:hypothetical protein